MIPSPSRTLRFVIIGVSLVVLAWVAGLISYAQKVPDSVLNVTERTDAIVVLTGGSERITTGVQLLERGLASQLFISGVAPSVTVADLLSADLKGQERLHEKITVGSKAEDTPGNAIETAMWTQENSVQSIRLVTAAYHMPRALLELERTMPSVKIIPHPVFPEQVKADWWRYPGTASLLAREYSKHLYSIAKPWAPGPQKNPK